MEENVSKFANAFVGKVVRSGSKVNGSSRPEVVLVSTFNKFTLNSAGMRTMGLVKGQKIVVLDITEEATDIQNRFFVTPGYDTGEVDDDNKAVFEGATLSPQGGFNYSVVWGNILSGDHESVQQSESDLVRKGLVEKKEGAKPVALKKIHMKLEVVADGEVLPIGEDAEGNKIEQKVWMLTDFEEKDHTPRNGDEDDIDAEVSTEEGVED